jgi:hypothetical protein
LLVASPSTWSRTKPRGKPCHVGGPEQIAQRPSWSWKRCSRM